MNKPKQCAAWLPPGFGVRCPKEIDPTCRVRCFKCCQRGNGSLPETNYLRCKNPQHPPYQETESAKQVRQFLNRIDEDKKAREWKYPYAIEDISNMNKRQLKESIRKDIQLLKEILPLEDCLLPDEDDTEMWDPSNTDDLEAEIDKIKLIINHANGLQAKLSQWEDYRDTETEEEASHE